MRKSENSASEDIIREQERDLEFREGLVQSQTMSIRDAERDE